MSYKRILVPVDGSATAARGLAEAVKLARNSRARLQLLTVVEDFPAIAAVEAGAAIEPILEGLRKSARRTLKRVTARAERAGARTTGALVENFGGRVADAIVAQAKRWRADLIVMGSHGRRGINRALMGSDAETVLRYSRVPVLVVPARGRR